MNGRGLLGRRLLKLFKYFCLFSIFATLIAWLITWEKTGFKWFIFDDEFKCLSDSLAISTCGCRGDSRGYHQKVIGYSLYGNFSDQNIHERYVAAMESVADQIRSAYPDWVVRIYSTANNSRILKKTFNTDKNDHVDICVVESALDESRPHLLKSVQLFQMVWRFLPLLDPMVDLFMSRDADSYIIERESVAVQEWVDSAAAFHVMRDHQNHCNPTNMQNKRAEYIPSYPNL